MSSAYSSIFLPLTFSSQIRGTYQLLTIMKARPQHIVFRAHSQNWDWDAFEVLEFWLHERDAIGLVAAFPGPQSVNYFVVLEFEGVPERSVEGVPNFR